MHNEKQTESFSKGTRKSVAGLTKFAGMLMLSVILLSGCVDGSARGLDVCAPWKPIFVSSQDQLTDGTAREIVAHNEVGERLCGWRAPGER